MMTAATPSMGYARLASGAVAASQPEYSSHSRPGRSSRTRQERAPKACASIDVLHLKELTVHRRHELAPWLHEAHCTEVVRTQLEAARPLVAWLAKHVGPAVARPRPG
jgi:hypothetical protein